MSIVVEVVLVTSSIAGASSGTKSKQRDKIPLSEDWKNQSEKAIFDE